MAGRPDLAGQLGQRHGAAMAARRRMVRGQHEVDRVAVQVVAVDAGGPRVRLVLPLVGQDEVDVAERQRRQRLLGLGLDELAAQAGRLARERAHGRDGEAQRGRLERGDPRPPGDVPAAAASSASASSARSSSASAWPTSTIAASVSRTPRPARSSSGTPGLALEHRELLRDGRGRELQGVGHRGDRAARVQLVQQAQAAQIEHRKQRYRVTVRNQSRS